MEIVREVGKQSRTILALTKCDDVNPDMVEELLISRILGEATDMPQQEKFFGCVGVINRTHKDKVTLDQAAAQESAKFREKIGGSLSPQQLAKVQANITVSHLIKQIDPMFHHDICSNWKRVALSQLQPQRDAIKTELQQLGPHVSELTAETVLEHVVNLVSIALYHAPGLHETIVISGFTYC